MNITGHPFVGREVHYDARMDGFTFAAQAGLGVALRRAAGMPGGSPAFGDDREASWW